MKSKMNWGEKWVHTFSGDILHHRGKTMNKDERESYQINRKLGAYEKYKKI